jgi:cytochrome c oxidase subunit 2
MDHGFHLFPESASRQAQSVDVLTLSMLGVTAFFTCLIAGLILWFSIRYRFTRTVNRREGKSMLLHWGIEIGWMTATLLILFVAYVQGARVYIAEHEPPDDPIEISVVGKQWMWKIAHESGRREINTLHVPRGRAVRMRMISEDVIHSFFVPVFRVKQDVLPGRYTAMWFEATQTGRFHLFCAEFCGTDHSKMRGEVVVLEPEEYAAWASEGADEPPDQKGRRIIDTFGCLQCHGEAATAPKLEGLLDAKVRLANGELIVADADYIRRSILNPQADLVAGYKPVMPTYTGKIDADAIDAIVAYLKAAKIQGESSDEQGEAK